MSILEYRKYHCPLDLTIHVTYAEAGAPFVNLSVRYKPSIAIHDSTPPALVLITCR
jgi:hypothetical protein